MLRYATGDWRAPGARFLTTLGALALLALLAAVATPAGAVCTAAQIIAVEPSCQNPLCFINNQHVVENGCTLDFGARDVTFLGPNGGLVVDSRTATLRARKLTIGGFIDGVPTGPVARGGMLIIEAQTDLVVGEPGRIDVSAAGAAGEIMITVGGSVSIAGKVQADFLNAGASGGLIVITAGAGVSSTSSAVISARGGLDSDGGGEIDLIAGGPLTLQSDLDVGGYDGGIISMEAGGKITLEGIDASGAGDAGSGGCVDAFAGTGAEVKGEIVANGATGTFMTGGCGGLICVDGGLGDVILANGASITADGASPDGGGGQVGLTARGSANVRGAITARGPVGETCGGDVCVEAGYDVSVFASGTADVSGGDSGGQLELLAGRDVTVNGNLIATGRQAGSLAGDVTLFAGTRGSGSLTVSSTVDVRSDAPCSEENGCGLGGITDLSGCNVTITNSADLLATGPDAGENNVTAREQLIVRGTLSANPTVGGGTPGFNRMFHRAARPPTVQNGGISPLPVLLALTTCPQTGPTDPPCLAPCPVCGNGTTEFPETCDLGMMPPRSCSGCSIYCQVEDCDDARTCTGDSCNQTFGCVNQPTPGCREPTATVTGTPPTPTVTRTASLTAIASATSTATGTANPAASPTPSASPSHSSSPSPTASATATHTGPATATATVSAVLTSTATLTATPAGSETPTVAATATAPPVCTGDCDGSSSVGINELVLGVNIALGARDVGDCPAFDRDDNGRVSINELVAAVNAALDGC